MYVFIYILYYFKISLKEYYVSFNFRKISMKTNIKLKILRIYFARKLYVLYVYLQVSNFYLIITLQKIYITKKQTSKILILFFVCLKFDIPLASKIPMSHCDICLIAVSSAFAVDGQNYLMFDCLMMILEVLTIFSG